MKSVLDKIRALNISVVETFDSFSNADDLVKFTRPLVGVEGFVVDFDGHKVKIKADHYVMIHRTKDDICSERKIAQVVLEESLDDILPLLDEADTKKVLNFVELFYESLEHTIERVERLVEIAKTKYGSDKKRIALEFAPTIDRRDLSYVFSALGGADIRQSTFARAKIAANSNTTFDEFMRWTKIVYS